MARTPIRVSELTPGVRGIPQLGAEGLAAQRRAGNALAGGVQDIGQAFDRVAEQQSAVYAAKAIADARAEWTRAAIEREQAAEGEAAGYTEQLNKDWQGYRDAALEKAPARARERMTRAFTDFGSQLEARALRFEATKRVAYRSDMAVAAIAQNQNVLLTDPSQFDSVMAETLESIDAFGLPDDKARDLKTNAKAGLAASAMQGLIEQNPHAALQRIDSGSLDSMLDPNDKASLQRRARGEIRRRQAEARAAANAARRAYLENFDDELAFIASGNPEPYATDYTRAELIRRLGEEDGQKAWALKERAREDGWNRHTILNGTPDEIAERRAELAADTQTPEGFRDAQERLANFDRMVQRVEEGLADDPVATLLATSERGRIAAESLGEDGSGTQEYARIILSEQADRNIPEHRRRVLSNRAASETVAQLQRTPAAERGAELAAMERQWGKHWPRVLDQLREEGLSSRLYHASLYSDDPALSESIAALEDVSAKDLRSGFEGVSVKDVEAAVWDEMADFRLAFEAGDATGAAAAKINELYDTAVGVALREFRRTENAGSAARSAVSRLVNDRYETVTSNHVTAYIPKGFSLGLIANGARAAMDEDALREFGVAPFGGDESQPGFIRESRVLSAARRGTWVTNNDATGLRLMAEIDGRMLPVRNADGEAYELSFQELEVRGSRRRTKHPATLGPAP